MKRFIAILFVCFFMLMYKANAQKNLVTNGGFEDDDLYGWNNNGAKQTPWAFKSGKNACAVIATGTDKWIGIDQIVHIPKKVQSIEFSAWVKTNNVVKGKDDWDGAVFTVVFLDARDKELGEGINIIRLTGDQDWTQANKIIQIPEKAYSFKILFALGNASGTLLVDDVSAKAIN
ncbi:hypothetical protein JN11_01317 [Mucilaginibacter frigoritolerans]|uniref:Carbohydrate binding protein n=1 Tax=Mucilaginibacter frigoritolerans TaxID=652788 RepID=A0A562UAL1_9SPHI|nr:hypothetical protein [Mucilaginibacter frigoritolerans]TWJ02345.1 hypothetical protein JN11_01317 [Mucilaginibacter frigoritolerans]